MESGTTVNGEHAGYLDSLRCAYANRNLTLYLGAGVSVANGIPTWEKLVSAMYFSAIEGQPMGSWRPFPNYLFAIAEWHLGRGHEPLDITARKIRSYYSTPEPFLSSLREALYAGFAISWNDIGFQDPERHPLREANPSLDSVAKLCESANGVQSVITYNYDELLEIALADRLPQPIWREQIGEPEQLLEQSRVTDQLPIYHVHGYVPVDPSSGGSNGNEIVFTEEQYHLAAHDDYSWSNLVQIRAMSTSIGLMIGLSGTDRSMRRLLDAVRKVPLRRENFILMRRPHWEQPTDEELDQIHESAQEYVSRFERSGIKSAGTKGPNWRYEIAGITKQVRELDTRQQGAVLRELGITPIWYNEHEEIPAIIAEICG